MTRSERFRKDRCWLKIRRFAITNSLKANLTEATMLTDWDRECLCYIQNKVLRETRKSPALYANIGAKYWKDKCGPGYKPFIDMLEQWGELNVNDKYHHGEDGKPAFTMSYMVSFSAWASGITKIDFRRRPTPMKDKTELKEADEVIRYVHQCCSRLTISESLVDIEEPIQDAAAHEFSRRVFWGDFNIRYGDKANRMYHSIIEMSKKARANLMFKGGGPPLFDYDIKSCHPVLLLPLFSDPWEKARFSVILDNDVYLTIRDVMGVPVDRDEMKIQFVVCTNAIDRDVAGKRGAAYQFFSEHFPVFTREVLDTRSDLAAYLQQQESQIMVQELGRFCIGRNLFWVACHDGWLGIEEGEREILEKVGDAFFQATGYSVRIKKTALMDSTFNCTYNIKGEGGVYGSYLGGEHTFGSSDYKKEAEDWFANLPRHPEPDAETLKKWQEASESRRQAFRDHKRRGVESDQLRRKARPLYYQLMGGSKAVKAA
jgi:hypothetical protein